MAISRPSMRGFLSRASGGLPAFPGSPLLLYWGGADSPCDLFAAAAFSTYDNAGGGTTVIAHSLGVATFNGESVEISGCTGDAALLNGTHTLTASGSNTFSIATPFGLPTTVGPVATGVGVFNPVLRWISQVTDQSGNGYHATCANRANAIRWDVSAKEFVGPPTISHNAIIAASGSGGNAYRSAVNGLECVFGMVINAEDVSNFVGAYWGGSGASDARMGKIGTTAFFFRTGSDSLEASSFFSAESTFHLGVMRTVSAGKEIYRDSVGSTFASNASTEKLSPGTSQINFMSHQTSRSRGRCRIFVQYADDDLTGAGELAALKAAIDARVAPYPGM